MRLYRFICAKSGASLQCYSNCCCTDVAGKWFLSHPEPCKSSQLPSPCPPSRPPPSCHNWVTTLPQPPQSRSCSAATKNPLTIPAFVQMYMYMYSYNSRHAELLLGFLSELIVGHRSPEHLSLHSMSSFHFKFTVGRILVHYWQDEGWGYCINWLLY